MIDFQNYERVSMAEDPSLILLLPPGTTFTPALHPLSSIKRVKCELEAFKKDGNPPLTQQHFFRNKQRSILPNRADHNLPLGIILALKYLNEQDEAWFELPTELQDNAHIVNYPVEPDPVYVRIKVTEIDFSVAVNPEDPYSYINAGLVSKNKGNGYYTKENYDGAIAEYVKGICIVTNFPKKITESLAQTEKGQSIQSQLRKIKIDLNNNLAMAYIRKNMLKEAKKCAELVLSLDEQNEKGLYRFAKVLELERDFEASLQYYERVNMLWKVWEMREAQKKLRQLLNKRLNQAFE